LPWRSVSSRRSDPPDASWQFADYALRRGNSPRWLLWAFVATAFAGFAAMLPISAAFVGTSMETFNRLMIFQTWI
jgi:hypothetical protein